MKKLLTFCLIHLLVGEVMARTQETPFSDGQTLAMNHSGVSRSTDKSEQPTSSPLKSGAIAIAAAADIMKQWNKNGEYLDETLIHALRPIFGELTDQLRLSWDARLIKNWAEQGHGIALQGADRVVQAYGNNIYIALPKSFLQTDPGLTLELLIHAATHAYQMNRAKGLATFGVDYFQAYDQAGFLFSGNRLEQQAISKARRHLKIALDSFKDIRCLGLPNIQIHPRGKNITFFSGKTWLSCTGYKLVFQHNADLVLLNQNDEPIWATGTGGTKADRLVIQADGNVVLYAGKRTLWATDTHGEQSFLSIREDGEMVVYGPERQRMWSSGTSFGNKQTMNAAAQWQRK
ncbi:MAG: hypothetical protein OEM02_11325 [Desulfobulbaceae bacterium]|nr:hypothetical protein [Desulfobulbaceae bacterium]